MTDPTTPIPAIPPAPEPVPAHVRWTARHRTLLVAAAVGVLAISAGIGIGAAVSSGSGPAAQAVAAPSSSESSAPPNGTAHRAVLATIVSEAGSTWAVRTKAGAAITVTITPQTRFGSKAAPGTRAQFRAGSNVAITGTLSQSAITATRIAEVKQQPADATPTASPSS